MGRFRLFRERAGIIGPTPVWVCIEYDSLTPSSAAGWMYTGDTISGCLLDAARRWRSDSALVGY